MIKEFGTVTIAHKHLINELQVRCVYNLHRVRTEKVKIQRAVRKKEFKETQERRAKGYAKNCDKPTTTKKRTISVRQPKSKRQRTTKEPKHICSVCGKGYQCEGAYNNHIKNNYKKCSKSKK